MPTEYEYERECDNIDYIMCGEQMKNHNKKRTNQRNI